MSMFSDIDAPNASRDDEVDAQECPRVLVVDDHVINRLVLQRQLGVLGFRADAAENGAAALQAMQILRYSLLITDCDMPVMNGFELTRRVRGFEAARGQPRMPIIAFTASEQASDQQCCTDAGMDDRLEKPTNLNDLRVVMERWLPSVARPPVQDGSAQECSTPDCDDAAGSVVPINLDVLRRVAGDDPAASERALQHFWRVNAVDVAALVQAIDSADLAATVREAHRMKGASRLVGAERFAAVCADIEVAGRRQDATCFGVLTSRFHTELKRLDDYLAVVVPA